MFAGIMDLKHGISGIEQGVFAAYINMASAAHMTKKRVRCSYLVRDKNRINSLTFL